MKLEFVKKIVVSTFVALAAVCVQAETETVDGITWTYTVSDGKASIGNGYSSAIPTSTAGAITIPSTLGGYHVTSIEGWAFSSCSSLTSVTIPDSVTSIGDNAFSGCYSLESVTIGNSVTSIGDNAFSGCYSLESVTMPNSVTNIGNYAFSWCYSLTSVTIPNSVTSIGEYAFEDCSSIKDVFINDIANWCAIGFGDGGEKRNIYLNGEKIVNVVIPDGVPKIMDGAFRGCSSLTSVIISDSVTSIGSSAFSGCNSLASTTIPDSVTGIGSSAFSGCSSLASTTIPDSVTSIGSSAFSGCSSLARVSIPDSVTSIGEDAFSGCSSLMSINVSVNNSHYSSKNGLLLSKDGKTLIQGVNGEVTIPNSVIIIEDNAFRGCSSLTGVTIPGNVTSIGKYAFSGCSSLMSVMICNSVTSIGERAFEGCSSLMNVTIPDSVTSIGDGTFSGCSSLTSVTIGDSVTSIGEYAFEGCSSLTSFRIPDSLTNVGYRAFGGCSSLTNMTIPNSVTCIGYYMFEDCNEALFDISTFPGLILVDGWVVGNDGSPSGDLDLAGIRGIGEYAFSGCSSLTSVTIPDGVINIGYGAFSGCSSLTSVTIPDSVKRIDYNMFEGCDETLFDMSTFPGLMLVDGWVVGNDGSPFGDLDLAGIRGIGEWAFYDCYSLESVTIPDGVTRIGEYAFAYCSSLTSIIIPKSVTSIGLGAFYECSSLESVTIPDGVTNIGEDTFYNCSSLESVTIPDGVTRIGEYAFQECSSLTSVMIGDGVMSIGYCAFWGCSSLASVTMGDSVTSIGGYAFEYCSSLTSVTIPDSVTSIGYCAFSGCGEFLVSKNNESYSSNQGLLLSKDGKTLIAGSDNGIVTIPNGITNICDYAFHECDELVSVAIPASVISIGNTVFNGCSSLKEIRVSVDNEHYSSMNGLLLSKDGKTLIAGINGDVVIPECVTSIGVRAFNGCSTLESIVIPVNVTSVGKYPFDGCSSLKNVTVPGWQCRIDFSTVTNLVISEGTTRIGNGAFENCSSLMCVTIPDSVLTIGVRAFDECRSLKNITIPNSVTNIGDSAFSYCSSLTSVTIPDSVANIGDGAFIECSSLVSVTIPNSVTNIGRSAFSYCSSLTSVTIPDSVTSIGAWTFSDCSSLTSVTIPCSVTSIDYDAFYGCNSIRSATVPGWKCNIDFSSVTNLVISEGTASIPDNAFRYCRSLVSVTIGDGVTSIGAGAFSYCSSLTSVTIPDSVANIGKEAFNGCSSLTNVTLPGGLMNIEDNVFFGCSDLENVTIPSCVTNIGRQAFYNCSSLVGIVIPSSVTSIGNKAFMGCSGLVDLVIPDGAKYIDTYAFYNCSSLVSVTMPGSMVNVGYNSFYGCSSLKTITVPGWGCEIPLSGITDLVILDGTTDIRDSAFYGSHSIVSVTIPCSVTNVGKNAFYNCISIRDVTVPGWKCGIDFGIVTNLVITDGTESIPDNAFTNCSSLVSVAIPYSVTNIGNTAFNGCSALKIVDMPAAFMGTVDFDGCPDDMLVNYHCRVSFDAAGGVLGESSLPNDEGEFIKDVIYDSPYGELPTASCEGYVFLGWTLDGESVDADTIVKTAGDHTLAAAWGIQIGNGIWATTICDDAIVLDEPLVAPTGEVEIPAEIAGRPIVGITADAFSGNVDITGIKIPESVIDVEAGAFDGCTGIRSVHIPYVTDEPQWMAKYFSDSYANITNVVLGSGIGMVGREFFTGCDALASVTLPAGLTNIARTAFSGCSNIAEVTWCATNIWTENVILPRPINVVKIFRNRWGQFLDENDNPINNSYISPRISDDMSTNMWAEVYFEEGGEYTFSWYVRSEENCDFLNLYVDGQYVDGISGYMRTRQAFTVELSPGEHILTWAYEKDGSVSEYSDRSYIYADEMNEFDDCKMGFGELFADSKASLRVLSFAEGVVSLPDGCLTGLKAVERVELPSTLEKFGDNDLRSLSKVENGFWIEQGWVFGYMGTAGGTVEIPEGVKGIASYAFEGQTLLDNVRLPDSLRYVGVNAFKLCTNLEEIDLPEGVVRIEDGAFKNCTYAQTLSLPTTLREVGGRGFENCTSLAGVTLPYGVVDIGEAAFSNCWRMMSVAIPSSVTNVGSGAFLDCRRLTGVTVPLHVDTMANLFPSAYDKIASVAVARIGGAFGESALPMVAGMFKGCAVLENLILPEWLREIPNEAFVGCSSMSSFSIPDAVTNIGAAAFKDLSQLTAFAFPTGLVSIGEEAFSGCTGISALTLPFRLERIGAKAFNGLSLLARTDIPESVSDIGSGAFSGCANVRAISLPGDVATVAEIWPDTYGRITSATVTEQRSGALGMSYKIVDSLFEGCDALVKIEMPTSLTAIGDHAFAGCMALTEAGIPSGVTELGAEAFSGCASLSIVALPKGLTALPDRAFAGCRSLTEIVVPEGVAEVGAEVVDGCALLRSVRFVGNNAPACDASAYAGTSDSLVTYVAKGSMGWDGITTSKSLPEFWPEGTSHEIAWWEPNRFMVTFDPNGGSGSAVEVEQVTGTTYILPPDATRRGAVFGGWWTATEGGARVTTVTQVALTQPHTFYAKWVFNRYAVHFDANGGEGEMNLYEMTVATSAELPECGFVRAGYAFAGWATEPNGEVVYADGEEVVDLAYQQNAAVTLYAVWEERVWTLADYVDAEGMSFVNDLGAEWTPDWSVSKVGGVSLRSGAIPAAEDEGGRTNTTLTATIEGEGNGSFWWKVSCEDMDEEYDEWYDYAVFAIDGVEIAKIAGDSGWQQVEYMVAGSGTHTLTWTFTRDDYDEEGIEWENAAWVDGFVWSPAPKVLTIGDVVSADAASAALPWSTGGDAVWSIDTTIGCVDGNSVKSGAVANGQSSWIEVAVSGAGTFKFNWDVQGGIYRKDPFACAKVEIDGVEMALEYKTGGWKEHSLTVEGSGSHTIRWTYLRTSARAAEGDCAWLDGFSWIPAPSTDVTVDVGDGKSVVVPTEWIDRYESIVSAAGGDKAALQWTAANGRKVWECFMLGVDPTKADDDFKITRFWMEGGKPMFEFSHSTDGAGNSFMPRIKTKGKAKLTDGWSDVPSGGNSAFRFFTVEVELP